MPQPLAVANEICNGAREVFAILVLIDESALIETLLDVGMKDEYMPVQYDYNRCRLVSRKDSLGHKNDCVRFLDTAIRERFRQVQWVFRPLVFDLGHEYRSIDYGRLHHRHPIPFDRVWEHAVIWGIASNGGSGRRFSRDDSL